jgi:ankyrin repeat protein
VKELIKANANIDIQNNNGTTALIMASYTKNIEIVKTTKIRMCKYIYL